MHKPLLAPLLLLFCMVSCTSGEDSNSKNKTCYETPRRTKYGELGDWYQVAMVYDKVNKLECFDIDTNGISQKMFPDLSFTIGRYQYRSADKCKYDISDDYRLLHNFDCNGDTAGDTITFEIGHLDQDYLVLITHADTAAWKDARTYSVLYKRGN